MRLLLQSAKRRSDCRTKEQMKMHTGMPAVTYCAHPMGLVER